MLSKLFISSVLMAHALAYTWPDPQMDELKAFYVQVDGYRNGQFGGFLTPCDSFLDLPTWDVRPLLNGFEQHTMIWPHTQRHRRYWRSRRIYSV